MNSRVRQRRGVEGDGGQHGVDSSSTHGDQVLERDLGSNEKLLEDIFRDCPDVVFRSLVPRSHPRVLIVYVDGLVDTLVLDQSVIRPLLVDRDTHVNTSLDNVVTVLSQQVLSVSQVKTESRINEVVEAVLTANVILLIDNENTALIAALQGFESRSIEEPKNEASIRGPRDCFTENLRTNTMLLRRRIVNPKLKFESFTIGSITRTQIQLAYIDDLVAPSLLESVRKRLHDVNMRGVLASCYIEEYIQDAPLSPFPQIQNTERPDVAVSSLLEGKVVIITNNTPFALILPMTFWSGLQAADDYYERFLYSVSRRIVRFVLTFFSLTLPAIYVSLTCYSPDLLPRQLMMSIATAREMAPFPTVIETVLMEFIFEGLQEAGVRLPNQLGPVVSIVGALVIGEAAVRANVVSAPIVIVVALTGISSYVIARYSFGLPFRLLRFALLLLSGLLGLYGLTIGLIAIMIHVLALESFGVPYFSPVAPLVLTNLKDVFIRTPRWKKRSAQK